MRNIVGKKVKIKNVDEIRNEIAKGHKGTATINEIEDYAGKIFTVTRENTFDPAILYLNGSRDLVINYYWIKNIEPKIPDELFEID